jgi:hypothetical protein
MGCCGSKEEVKDDNPLIVDVQKAIADDVWQSYLETFKW